MRKVTLLFAMIAFASFAFAQKGFVPQKYNLDKAVPGTALKSDVNHTKAPGDVIFSEDFDGADWSATSNNGEPVPENAPAGWEIGDMSGNGFYWRWDTIGPRGVWTSDGDDCHVPRGKLGSTTGANGFMMLEAGYFNSAADCSTYFEDGMDSYVEYNAGIDFSAETAVHLTFEQANRFCCGYGADADAWFRVSTDNGATWTGLSVSEGDINTGVGNLDDEIPFVSEYDISPDVAGQSNVWFRFHMNGLSHYHWEIDDVLFVVPEEYDIQFNDYWNDYITYRDGSTDWPISAREDFTEGFYEYPWFLVQEYKGFHAAYINFGGLNATNFTHNVEIYRDSALVESFATPAIASLSVGAIDTSFLQATAWPWQKGEYTFVHYPSSDNADNIPSNDTLYRYMKVGDSIMWVSDINMRNDAISPDNWTSYNEDGDGLGFEFNLPAPSLHDQDGNADYYILEGAYLNIARNTDANELALFESGEARVVAGVYKYDSVNDTYTEQISSAEMTLSLNDTNSMVYVPFAKDGTSEYLFAEGQFVLAFNMYGTWNRPQDGNLQGWNVWSVDNSAQKNSREACVTVNASIAVGDDVGWTGEGPVFGLKMTYTEEYPIDGISSDYEKLDFNVYPNPSNGTFHINAQGTSQVTIMNTAGQVVDSRIINGAASINVDLTTGVYFVRVQNGNKVGTKRLIIE